MNRQVLDVVIADPHDACRALLRERITGHQRLNVVAEARSASDVERIPPSDVVFASVDRSRDVLGQLRRLASASAHVVVLADTPAYAVDAFEAGATDYLLKPLDAARVDRTLVRLQSRAGDGVVGAAPLEPRSRLDAALTTLPRLAVRTAQGFTFVDPDDIESVVAEGNYALLDTGEHTWRMRRTLSELHAQLGNEKFLRIHRCALINATKVRSVERLGPGTLDFQLQSGRRFTSARSYARELRAWLRKSA
jgi:two-component system, LytTR family, response regulator